MDKTAPESTSVVGATKKLAIGFNMITEPTMATT